LQGARCCATTSRKAKLWEAFEAEEKVILLIDEIDKADIEFPNDLCSRELDQDGVLRLRDQWVKRFQGRQTPDSFIIYFEQTSKELPDAFLRRCFFHYIAFPDRNTMQRIVDVAFSGNKKELVSEAMDIFSSIVRQVPG